MPEPTGEAKRLSEEDDKYDCDRDDPFDNGHTVNAFSGILMVLQICFVTTIVNPLLHLILKFYYYPILMKPRMPTAMSLLGTQWVSNTILGLVCENVPGRGVSPACLTVRLAIGKSIWVNLSWMLVIVCDAIFTGRANAQTMIWQHQLRARDGMTPWHAMRYFCPFLTGLMVWAPRKYGTRSFYHRYCCEYFPHGRVTRICAICYYAFGFSYVFAPVISTITLMSNDAIWIALFPAMTFGFKRLSFICNIPFLLDDGPFKNYAMIPHSFNVFTLIQGSVAMSALQSENVQTVAQFVIIDWVTAVVRLVLLTRIGHKTCPGLFRFMLAKALENVPRPMYKAAANLGDATSMRLNQGFLCLMEGVTLSICFINLTFVLIWQRFILQDPQNFAGLLPSKLWAYVAIFVLSDIIQDNGSEHILKKFSNWSFILIGLARTHFRPFIFLGQFIVSIWSICFTAGVIVKCRAIAYGMAYYYTNYAHPLLVYQSTELTQNANS